MDPFTQISQKLLVERARQNSQQRSPIEAAPPPYTSSESGNESDDEDEDDEPQSPLKLTINAAHSIQGSNNLVPTSSTPLADATKFSSLLLHAVNQMNDVAGTPDIRSRRNVKLELTINCGITVVGDRNVIGQVGLKPRPPPSAIGGPMIGLASHAGVGAKRKAEENSEDDSEPKRVAVDDASSS